jgi:hypothetical protein
MFAKEESVRMKRLIGTTPHLAAASLAIQLAPLLFGPARAADIPSHYKLVYEQKFDGETALQDFVMTEPKAWKRATTNDITGLELVRQSKYAPAVRSPVNIALVRDKLFTDFVLEADLMQTGREYGHRDMCLFFGFQSPTNFYYAHIATAADDHAHNVFIVKRAPRTKIAKQTTKGVNWGLGSGIMSAWNAKVRMAPSAFTLTT